MSRHPAGALYYCLRRVPWASFRILSATPSSPLLGQNSLADRPLMALLLSRALAKKTDEEKPQVAGTENGLEGLVERFRRGGLEEVMKSWIDTGPNKAISPNQLHQALGPETVDGLSRETGMPRDDLLDQLSRLLPEVIDKLTPNGQVPREENLLPELKNSGQRPERRLA